MTVKDLQALTQIPAGDTTAQLQRTIYSNDASVYQQIPVSVAFPKGNVSLISFIPGMSGISVLSRMYDMLAAGCPSIS